MDLCDKYREMISAKIDGEYYDEKELSAHTTECNNCRKFEKELRIMNLAIKSMPEFKLSDDFNEKLKQRIKLEKKDEKGLIFNLKSYLSYAAGVAAVVVGVLIFNNNIEKEKMINSGIIAGSETIEKKIETDNNQTIVDSLKSTDQIKKNNLKTYQVNDEK
ncbi:MAG: hypothetical protein JXR48_03325 [Candidatus Delongbacteria bacterium]|nr:hypothetical protein [Candidatus Delongbacteria bacterium]MBN2833979.1 hypothetical protein [Candidatus Delongbacteria bacterium]